MTKQGMLIFSLAAAGFLQAQEEVPPPKEPLLARTGKQAEWVITFRPDEGKSGDGESKSKEDGAGKEAAPAMTGFPKEIRVSKDGDTYREIALWPDGKTSEKWVVDGLQVRDTSHGDVVRIMSPAGFYAPEYSDYTRSDFEDVEWIAKSNYQGVQAIKDAKFYKFMTAWNKRKQTPREVAERKMIEGYRSELDAGRVCTVLLDVATQLPMMLADGYSIRTFSYSTRTEKLVPPAKFAQAIDDWKKEIKRKTSVPLPP